MAPRRLTRAAHAVLAPPSAEQVAAVPADAAGRVLARVAASRGEGGQQGVAPLVVFGLLQHECKLSVQVVARHCLPARLPGLPSSCCLLPADSAWPGRDL